MTLDAMEFLRRFLQHVLPAGFQKVRHYGFLSPNSGTAIEAVRWLVTLHNGAIFVLSATARTATAPSPCRFAPHVAVRSGSWDSCRHGRRFSTRVNPMSSRLSHFLTVLAHASPSRGPIAVRAEVGFSRVCGPRQANHPADTSLSPPASAMRRAPVTTLLSPVPARLSPLSALRREAFPIVEGPARSPPGFLNMAWRSGFADSNPFLFKAGDADAVDEACRRSAVGKLLPNALYVHRTALDALDPLLRVFEGCARTYLGEIEGANLIKLHRQSGKVSYLVYPEFETNPHPALLRSVKLSLRTRQIDCLEYGSSPNPPILHRKESFLLPEHPLHARFARLSAQEEKHGLLSDTASIGTRDGWNAVGGAAGFAVRGHRLVRRKDQDSKGVGSLEEYSSNRILLICATFLEHPWGPGRTFRELGGAHDP